MALEAVTKVIEHMRVCKESLGAPDTEKGMAMIRESLATIPGWSLDDATSMLKALRTSDFNGEQRCALGDIINSKVTGKLSQMIGAASTTDGRVKKQPERQTCLTFYKYLSQQDWDIIRHPSTHWNTIKTVICNRFLLMGMSYPNEHTCMAAWSAVVVARATPGQPLYADVHEALKRKDELHSHLEKIRGKLRMHYHGKLKDYPDDPSKLEHQLPDAFAALASQPPAVCPVAEDAIEMVRARLPCRNSNSLAQHLAAPPRRRAPRAVRDLPTDDCPGLLIYDTPRRVGGGALALRDREDYAYANRYDNRYEDCYDGHRADKRALPASPPPVRQPGAPAERSGGH